MKYTVWKIIDGVGVPLRSGTSTNPQSQANADDGELVMEGVELDDELDKINPDTLEIFRIERVHSPEQLRQRINAERDRRIVAGLDHNGVRLTGNERDQVNLLALKDTARDLIGVGVTDPVIPFRDGLNVMHMLTPAQIVDLSSAGKLFITSVYQASWALKEMNPIPQDVENNQYWP